MLYQSTRGGGAPCSFEEVLVGTYASGGGLFVPTELPHLSPELLDSWRDLGFAKVCARILHLFSGIDLTVLEGLAHSAFSQFNDGVDPLPLRQVGDLYFLDTSLGPTFAFKDIGQQMVGRIMNHVLTQRHERANILVETSGDTGPAAIAGVRGCEAVHVFCLYPHHRVSTVQELQMITLDEPNVHVYRTEGNTDEQASVLKEIFADEAFVREHRVCSVNSINWVRIAAQSSYYVWAYLHLKHHVSGGLRGGERVDFVVPTGAFGNAMGGYLARLMGIPIGRITCATNANDIVHRTIHSGDMRMSFNVPTESPAMDIQFAYNLERMLFYVLDQDSNRVAEIMQGLEAQFRLEEGAPGVQLPRDVLAAVQDVFRSCAVSDADTLATIRAVFDEHGVELCPHSAVGVCAARALPAEGVAPRVCVLTAHPAKFESAIEKALGRPPALPAALQALKALPHKFRSLDKASTDWRACWVQTLKDDVSGVH